jgi:hypothetical protein
MSSTVVTTVLARRFSDIFFYFCGERLFSEVYYSTFFLSRMHFFAVDCLILVTFCMLGKEVQGQNLFLSVILWELGR